MDEPVDIDCVVPSDTIGCRIHRLGRLHHALLADALASIGLYAGQENALAALWEDGPITQTQLAEKVGVDTSTICRTLQRLERSGLVVRRTSETDRRATAVSATDRAEPLRDRLADVYRDNEVVLLAGLAAEEIAQLARLLDKVINNLARAAEVAD